MISKRHPTPRRVPHRSIEDANKAASAVLAAKENEKKVQEKLEEERKRKATMEAEKKRLQRENDEKMSREERKSMKEADFESSEVRIETSVPYSTQLRRLYSLTTTPIPNPLAGRCRLQGGNRFGGGGRSDGLR
jgi:hypothetical protein